MNRGNRLLHSQLQSCRDKVLIACFKLRKHNPGWCILFLALLENFLSTGNLFILLYILYIDCMFFGEGLKLIKNVL